MITEDYVSFETAKLLKEKGFDEDINFWYNENGNEIFFQQKYDIMYNWRVRQGMKIYQCPTLQMVMKWLREVYKIIPIILTDENSQDSFYYWFRIDTIKEGKWEDAIYRENEKAFPTYEEACEAAIKYCLENLI